MVGILCQTKERKRLACVLHFQIIFAAQYEMLFFKNKNYKKHRK